MDMDIKKIGTPLDEYNIGALKTGDMVNISGVIYTARDAAHKKLVDALERGDDLPFQLKGQIIYYSGPSPARDEQVIGSAGPTTSNRMDAYTPQLLAHGMKACIGKGSRSRTVREALREYKGVYLAAIGGAGALLSRKIRASEIIAYPELGPEAVYRLEVVDFPAIVINDIYGRDLYDEGREKYKVKGDGKG